MPQTMDTFLATLSSCAFPGLEFKLAEDLAHVEGVPEPLRCYWLQVVAREGSPYAVCTRTGEVMEWTGRKHRLSVWMTETELVWTAFYAITTALQHEAREKFTFEGVPVADSHLDIRKLVELGSDPVNLDARWRSN